MSLQIREPRWIAFDNGWSDGASGRKLGESPWFDSPVSEERRAYCYAWRYGRTSVTWNLETDSPDTTADSEQHG